MGEGRKREREGCDGWRQFCTVTVDSPEMGGGRGERSLGTGGSLSCRDTRRTPVSNMSPSGPTDKPSIPLARQFYKASAQHSVYPSLATPLPHPREGPRGRVGRAPNFHNPPPHPTGLRVPPTRLWRHFRNLASCLCIIFTAIPEARSQNNPAILMTSCGYKRKWRNP